MRVVSLLGGLHVALMKSIADIGDAGRVDWGIVVDRPSFPW